LTIAAFSYSLQIVKLTKMKVNNRHVISSQLASFLRQKCVSYTSTYRHFKSSANFYSPVLISTGNMDTQREVFKMMISKINSRKTPLGVPII